MESEEAQVEVEPKIPQEPKTPVEDLLEFHLAFCHRAYLLCAKKNHDYAGAHGLSPYRNFESIEALGIASTESGLLIRMTDKINRLVTFVNDGKLAMENETAIDALLDIVNYSVILAAYMRVRRLREVADAG